MTIFLSHFTQFGNQISLMCTRNFVFLFRKTTPRPSHNTADVWFLNFFGNAYLIVVIQDSIMMPNPIKQLSMTRLSVRVCLHGSVDINGTHLVNNSIIPIHLYLYCIIWKTCIFNYLFNTHSPVLRHKIVNFCNIFLSDGT